MKSPTLSVLFLQETSQKNPANTVNVFRELCSNSTDYDDAVSKLTHQEAQAVVDLLDGALGSIGTDTDVFQKFRTLCGRCKRLPTSHLLSERLSRYGAMPIAYGGFGEVWKGAYNGSTVAIKSLKTHRPNDTDKLNKKFVKEVVVWKRLSHPNIVNFLGVEPSTFCMVSEWMTNGDIRHYVRSNPETNRFKLMMDVTEGLAYLHRCKVVHGDLKGDNILVDSIGRARLCDFGLATVASISSPVTSGSSVRGSYRWMAPELFNVEPEDTTISPPTEKSDVFAFGRVVIEIFTGDVPFSHQGDFATLTSTLQDERPERPAEALFLGLTDDIWKMVESSWCFDPNQRPTSCSLLDQLHKIDPGFSFLPRNSKLDFMSQEDLRLLHLVMDPCEDYLQLDDKDAQVLIDILQGVLDDIFPVDSPPSQVMKLSHTSAELHRKCLIALRQLCYRTGYIPKSYQRLQDISTPEEVEFSSGKLADVQGKVHYKNRLIAIKVFKISHFERFKQRILCEDVVLRQLNHYNIVPFIGVSYASFPLCTVSEWMPNGNIMDYLLLKPRTNRVHLLENISNGLEYLHSVEIVHGSLKGSNILINNSGVACLIDFGLVPIAAESIQTNGSSLSTLTSARWMAPELLDPTKPKKKHSPASDVYSFAMTVLQVYTGKVPFWEHRKKEAVRKVLNGERPGRLPHHLKLPEAVWELVGICWRQDPDRRPSASFVHEALAQANTERDGPRQKPSAKVSLQPFPKLLADLQKATPFGQSTMPTIEPTRERTRTLESRRFPDLLNCISGVSAR